MSQAINRFQARLAVVFSCSLLHCAHSTVYPSVQMH